MAKAVTVPVFYSLVQENKPEHKNIVTTEANMQMKNISITLLPFQVSPGKTQIGMRPLTP